MGSFWVFSISVSSCSAFFCSSWALAVGFLSILDFDLADKSDWMTCTPTSLNMCPLSITVSCMSEQIPSRLFLRNP